MPWGRNNPYTLKGRHVAQRGARASASEVLPVVVVKDPLTWLKSMCRRPAGVKFDRAGRCPSPLKQATVTWPTLGSTQYASLVHLWAAWHASYLDAAAPRLLIRYEDLLFRPLETVSDVCRCAGGVAAAADVFDSLDEGFGRGPGRRRSRRHNLRRYGNASYRDARLDANDVAVLDAALADHRLVRHFRYGYKGEE